MTATSSTHLTCLCGSICEPGTLLSDHEAPLQTTMCHCNSCRLTTGSLGISFARLKSSPSFEALNRATSYKSSALVTRYFCSTCGCYCFFWDAERKAWFCLSGIVESNPASETGSLSKPENIAEVLRHEYVSDTVDGGLAACLLQVGERSIPAWATAPAPQELGTQDLFDLSHPTILSLPSKAIEKLPLPQEESHLVAECHCGGVSLSIRRANHTAKATSRCDNNSDPTKYLTYLCACRSCRLTTGTSLVPWTLVYPEDIFNANSVTAPNRTAEETMHVTFGFGAFDPDANPGLSLAQYRSSADVCRSFCAKCGATVFYWSRERPDELDIAVGILRSQEGSMARRWLEWDWGRCSFPEECIDREIYEAWSRSGDLVRNQAMLG